MWHSTRGAIALVGALAASVSALGAAPAQSAEVAPSTITVHSTDYNVASGQHFRLLGKLRSEGVPVADATVRVKTFRNGEWVRLKGAVVSTHEDGHYNVGITLQMPGNRKLRVIGDPPGEDIATAVRTVTVVVS